MCLITTLWQQSYLLITNEIEVIISAQEEVEYYGLYDPSVINVIISLICFKFIEYLGEKMLKSIFLKVNNFIVKTYLTNLLYR
jgi:hypothetical protein